MVTRVWFAVLLAGCGRIGFDVTSSVAADATVGGDGGPGGPCANSIDRFADDFEDGVTSLADWAAQADPGTSYAEQGGDLVLTLATTSNVAYAGYISTHAYDLRDTRVVAQNSVLPAAAANLGLSVELAPTMAVSLTVFSNMMYAGQTISGTFSVLASVPFNSANRYWAISERAGRIYYEASPDGVAFTSIHDVAEPFIPQSVRIHLFAGTEQSIGSPGVAHYAAFNPGKTRSAGCPISTLADDFADGLPGDWDELVDTCCTLQETASVLQVSTNGTSGRAVRSSRAGYDLRDGEVRVRVDGGPSVASAFDARLFVHRTDQDEVDLRIGGAAVTAHTIINGTPNNVAVARTGAESYIRIRETAGTLYFETSADKVAWSVVHQLPTPFAVDDVEVRLQGSANTATAADTFRFDDLDL